MLFTFKVLVKADSPRKDSIQQVVKEIQSQHLAFDEQSPDSSFVITVVSVRPDEEQGTDVAKLNQFITTFKTENSRRRSTVMFAQPSFCSRLSGVLFESFAFMPADNGACVSQVRDALYSLMERRVYQMQTLPSWSKSYEADVRKYVESRLSSKRQETCSWILPRAGISVSPFSCLQRNPPEAPWVWFAYRRHYMEHEAARPSIVDYGEKGELTREFQALSCSEK
jgi:hypothetical protein